MQRSMRLVFAVLALGALAAAASAQDIKEQQRLEESRKHYRAGEEFLISEAFEKAEAEFKSATDLDANYVMAFYGLGQARMSQKKYPGAVEAYSAARDLFLRGASNDRRTKAEKDKQLRDEIREMEQLISRVRSQQGRREAGSMEGQLVSLEQRLSVLRDQLGRDNAAAPQVPAEVSLGLGSAYFRQNQLEPAEQNYRAAIAADNKLGAAHNNLAVILMLTGRLDEAEREMKAAEKAGFTISPKFKEDLKQRQSAKSKS